MRDYIILNNKNSNEIKGLLIQNLPPITKPRIRAEIDEIDGRDGDIVTPLGYGAYDKAFSIGLYGDFDINEVIKYFDSEGIVIFSNEPNKYYNYKILEQIDFEKLIRFRTADVMMHVQPFKYSTTEGKETEEMETKTASGSEIDLPDTNNEKLQMEKLKGDAHQDTIDAEEGNENEDTNLAVNDVDPSKENYITLKGNTTQDQHESQNLLQITAPATQEFFGITITNNGDGTFTLNGTATNPLELYLPNLDMTTHYLGIKKGTNYFLNGCMAGGSLNTYNFIIEGTTWYADTGNGVQFNSYSDDAVHAYLSIARGVTLDNAIFKPMLVEGTEAQEFEPYGKVTPSPQYPSEVKVVKGENVVSVQGKNVLLLPNQSITHNGVTITTYEDGRIVINGTATGIVNTIGFVLPKIIPYKSNKQYSFSLTYISGSATNLTGATTINLKKGVVGESSYGDFISINNMQNDYAKNFSKSITTTDENSITRLQFISYFTNQVFDNLTYKLQLEEGSTATEYEPYSKKDYPIPLGNIELCKIGDYQDYLYKRNGKWYVHKKIGKVVLDGSEGWKYIGTQNNRSVFQWDKGPNNKYNVSNIPLFCDKFTQCTIRDADAYSVDEGIANGSTGYSMKIITKQSSTLNDLTTWLSTHNTIVYYILATPTEEEITDETLLAQLDNLHTAQLQETSYINSTPYKEYPYINLKYNVVTPAPSPDRASEINKVTGNNTIKISNEDGTLEANYPINLVDIELCKIGDYQDYLYKNNGKWYVHKEINKVVLDGSENWVVADTKTSGKNRFAYNVSSILDILAPSSSVNLLLAYCNLFKPKSATDTYNQNNGISCRGSKIIDIYYEPIAQYNTSDFKTWLSTHNTIVYYVLVTPTEEEITDETLLAQLEALDNIYNQKGTTKIKTNPEVNNMPLSLDVSYTESRPITITNSGNIYSKPIFTIYGEGNIGVYLNDIQLFSINLGSEEQITIDVAEMQAYNKETKALKNRLVTGNYDNFLLKIGENKISFSGIVKKFEIENYSRWI